MSFGPNKTSVKINLEKSIVDNQHRYIFIQLVFRCLHFRNLHLEDYRTSDNEAKS